VSSVTLCQQTAGGADGQDDLRLAAASGFRTVSLHTSRLGGEQATAWRAELDRHGLAGAGYMSLRNVLAGAPDAHDVLTAAATLGASHVVVTTGPLGGRTVERADDACREWFATMQPVAADLGIVLALEPLHPLLEDKSYVHDIRHAAALVREVPGAEIVADTGHLWWDVHLSTSVPDVVDLLVCVQLSDVPRTVSETGVYRRCPLGSGVVPNAEVIKTLSDAGFDGPYEYETPLPPEADRVRSLLSARRWIESLVSTPKLDASAAATSRAGSVTQQARLGPTQWDDLRPRRSTARHTP
jgi:sugar phosphate isomerase/epimerase